MNKSLKILVTTLIIFLGYNQSLQAQDFRDVLETVFLSQSSQTSSDNAGYTLLNMELIDMKDINFSKEIRAAKNNKTILEINENEKISKAKYLKVLRSSANSTENIDSFYSKVYKKIPALESVSIDESTLSKLYITVKSNTLHGKLDDIGSQLTWL